MAELLGLEDIFLANFVMGKSVFCSNLEARVLMMSYLVLISEIVETARPSNILVKFLQL